MSLLGGPSLSVNLAEPLVFVTAPNRSASSRTNIRPVLIRGLLVLKLPKATKITGIEVILDGKSTTKWPEGIGPRRLEVAEHISLAFLRMSLLDLGPTPRRALSLGPGTQSDEYDDFLRQFSNTRETTEPDTTAVNGEPLRIHVPQRAVSAIPAYERHTLRSRIPPPDPTPPYTLLPDNNTPLTQSSGEVAPGDLDSSPDRNGGTEHTDDAIMLSDRGRTFLRTTRDSPAEWQHWGSNRGHEYAPTTRYTDGDSGSLAPEAGVDSEDHPMPVIPEAATSTVDLGDGLVDAQTISSTRLPSAGGSVDRLELYQSTQSSSTDHSGAEPSQGANASLPILSGGGGALYAPPSAPVRAAAPFPIVTQQIPTTNSSTSNQTFQRPFSSTPPAPQPARHSPSTTSTGHALESPQAPSPATSLQSLHIARTNGAHTNRDDRSPSRGQNGHSSRFGLSSVTRILREVSQDVRDAVGIGHHNTVGGPSGGGQRSRSRTSQVRGELRRTGAPVSLIRPPSLPVDREPEMSSPQSAVSQSFVRRYGRGGTGSGDREGTRSPTRDSERDGGGQRRRSQRFSSRIFEGDDDEFEGHRGRDVTVNPLGDASHFDTEAPPQNEGWKEFRKGTYTYPISLAIPPDLPPSLHCDFGSVSYRLSATVHRAGTFAPKLTSFVDLQLVSCLAPEATNDMDNIIIQRSWEDKLSYVVHVEGTAFPVGGVIPVNISLMPLDKISLYRVTLGIEEKIDYYAHAYKVARHEPVRFHKGIQIQHPDIHERLLPIISDSSTAASGSPLAEYVHPERDEPPDLVIPPTESTENLEHTSDVVSHLLNPAGPWYLRFEVPIPGCDSGIHFTNKGHGPRIVVAHRLRVALRVAAGLAERIGTNEKLKLYDIIIEAPIYLLSCHCASRYTHLPTYSRFAAQTPSPAQTSAGCSPANAGTPGHHCSREPSMGRSQSRGQGPVHHQSHAAAGGHSHANMLTNASSAHMRSSSLSRDDRNRTESAAASTSMADPQAIQRSEQFERLVAGEESEAGEQPPAYS